MRKLIVRGEASQCEIKNLQESAINTKKNLMDLLRENGVNIASSCFGEGVCKKCLIYVNEEEVLSCQRSLADFSELNDKDIIIKISYL